MSSLSFEYILLSIIHFKDNESRVTLKKLNELNSNYINASFIHVSTNVLV